MKKKKVLFGTVVIVCTLIISSIFLFFLLKKAPLLSPLGSNEFSQYIRTLDKFSFSRLSQEKPDYSSIKFDKTLKKSKEFTSFQFSFNTHGKKVTGLMNIPTGKGPFPVIVMIRGYVDKEIYYTGLGTQRGGEYLASHGYITVAPDFLGYAGSDDESTDIFEARFEKPRTVIDLLAAVTELDLANSSRIGILGHSNGGQIALSVLEITEKNYPTVLWAPVTQAFPDSIFQYIDELPDKGEYIKKSYDEFSTHYLPSDYSIASHFDNIMAPIDFHQGLSDEAVNPKETEKTVDTLTQLGKSIHLYEYPSENHNFTKGSFDALAERSLSFFSTHLR